MIAADILKQIKQIEIYTHRMLTGSLVGDSRSAIKGQGLEFDQIREYQMGDDVRFIDWRASARMNELLVKQYIEERNRTILLAVDISASTFFSSNKEFKNEHLGLIASVLALVAVYGKDHVGLILFSDEVHEYIPPSAGKKHARFIMQKVLTEYGQKRNTNIDCVIQFAANLKRKDVILFMLSDFISPDFSKGLRCIAKQYDVIAIRCLDAHESSFSDVGFLTITDPETGDIALINAQGRGLQDLNIFLTDRTIAQDTLFAQCGVDCIQVTNDKEFMGNLIRFFRRRMRY